MATDASPLLTQSDRPVSADMAVDGAAAPISTTAQQVGPWQLLSSLGEGSFCRVYLARPADGDERRGAAHAVKVLRAEWEDCPQAIEFLRREAYVGSMVQQPNVAPVLETECRKSPYYVVMPQLSGQSLAAAMANGWRPVLPVALWIARQVAVGLAAIQRTCGMIHGDVKPSNIFVAPNGHATLIDLGFARSAEECRAAVDRPVLGSLQYAAPESITSAFATDARSDIYSLGATLYEMITGVSPFEAATPGDLVRMHQEARPPCIRERRPNVPKPIALCIHKMLSKNPLRRPQTLNETIDQIVRLEVEWFADRAA